MQPKVVLCLAGAVLWAAWAAALPARDSQCYLAPHHSLSKAAGVGVPCVTHCLLDQLGQPQTEAERLLTYLTAVSDYCAALGSNLTLCHSEPLCQVMLLAGDATIHVESYPTRATAGDWWQALTKRTHQECWPDWLRILNQECQGSRQARFKQCMGSSIPWVVRWSPGGELHDFRTRLSDENFGWIGQECPRECLFVTFDVHFRGRTDVFPRTACLPAWVVHRMCGNKSCGTAAAAPSGSGHCYRTHRQLFGDMYFDSTGSVQVDVAKVACSVAVVDALSSPGNIFQGSCPHQSAVAQLFRAMPQIFSGHDGCSVRDWLSVAPTKQLFVARVHVCGIWPDLRWDLPEPGSGDYYKVHQPPLLEDPVPRSISQIALLQCASGYRHMHAALSSLWWTPGLYNRLLEGSGSWSQALPRAGLVCRAWCAGNSSQADASMAELAWDVLKGTLQSYCTGALVSSAAQQASTDGSQFGCADALSSLRRNWLQHQLLATVWLLYCFGLVSGLLALYLLHRSAEELLPYRVTMPGGLWSYMRKVLNGVPPWYHPIGLPSGSNRATRVLHLVRVCWFVADTVMDVVVAVTLPELYGLPLGVEVALSWRYWWLVVVMVAQFLVAMVFSMPSVLSSYGFLDFARVCFSMGCCVVVFLTFAWVMFLVIFVFVGAWFTAMADLYMMAVHFGVPERWLLGNKLNVGAYTTVRFMCQGVIQALPSALVSTAAIDALLVTDACNSACKQVLWASLLLSMSRFAAEVFSLAVLTHRLRARCFVTAVVDVVHHLQPRTPQYRPDKSFEQRAPGDGHSKQARLASLDPGHVAPHHESPHMMTQAPRGMQAARADSKADPGKQLPAFAPAQHTAAEGHAYAAGEASAVPQVVQAAVPLSLQHCRASVNQAAVCCCGSRCGRGCWPQQYPRFTVGYVWVVSLLAGAFVSVVCSHIIWPWLFFDAPSSGSFFLSAASLRPYSLLGLWGNWKLSGSVKGSLAAVKSCDLRGITCNLTAV